MKNTSAFLSFLFGIGLVCTNTQTAFAQQPNTAKADTSEPNITTKPINSIGTKTNTVKENTSGMAATLPFDPSVRTGVLSNGMTYYLRQNSKPEKRVELRLAVNAGSMQEEDDQRGLAHFVEHMAFNGTVSFKKNELVGFLENTGVRFGADLNAYTSFDETVYMLQLPTDKEGLVDKGLLVMRDWATGVSFDGDEIDKERGVIESEWRTRLGAGERLRQAYWPKIFYKSRYADRLPIGTMEVILKAPHERLRTFYKDWYRPNLMALVVVGDFNVDEMEKKVKEEFSKLQNPATSREKKLYEVPKHEETFVSIATDKEATGIEVELIYKHTPVETKTFEDYRAALLRQLYNSMLNDRFGELAQAKDAPFVGASAYYGGWVRSTDVYAASANPKETGIVASLQALLTEHARLIQHGFTDSELERQKLSITKALEKQYNERDKTASARLSMEYVQYFLDNQPAMGIEKEFALTKELLPTIKLDELNQLAKRWITDNNRCVIVTGPDKAGVKLPTEAEIRDILAKAKDIKTEPYKDKFLDLPLIAQEPKPGKVTEKKVITEEKVDITEIKLSNGIRIFVKPTTFQKDQILFQAYSPGGHSLYSDKDYFNAANADAIIDEAGVGAFDNIALEKKLTGKNIGVTPFIDELYEGFIGSSTIEDFPTALQLVYLYSTQPRKDKDAFERYVSQSKEQIKNLGSNPMAYFYDQVMRTRYNSNIRRRAFPETADYDKLNYDRAFQIYKERFSDFSDFTFVFVGNIDVEKATPLFEQYLGSLPSKKRVESGKDLGIKSPTKAITNSQKKGLAPQSNVYITFAKDEEWSREKEYKLASMVAVLNIMIRENLREDKGGVYSPQVNGSFQKDPHGMSEVNIVFQCAPENVEKLIQAVKDEVKKLQTEGTSDDNFNKIREIQRRNRESNLEKNEFWRGAITTVYQRKQSPGLIMKYYELVDKLTKDDIKNTAKSAMDLNKAIIINVNPEKITSDKP